MAPSIVQFLFKLNGLTCSKSFVREMLENKLSEAAFFSSSKVILFASSNEGTGFWEAHLHKMPITIVIEEFAPFVILLYIRTEGDATEDG